MARRKPITAKKHSKAAAKTTVKRGFSSKTHLPKKIVKKSTPKKRVKTITVKKKSAVIYSHPNPFFTQLKSVWSSAINTVRQTATELKTQVMMLSSTTSTAISDSLSQTTQKLSETRYALRQKLGLLKPAKKKKKTKKKSVIKKIKKKIAKLNSKLNKTKNKIIRNTLHFIKKEVIGPFVYVFRYHPFITFGSILVSLFILGSSYVVYDVVFKDLPPVTQITERQQILTTRILDRNGNLLYRIYKDENRTLIPLSQVPTYMREATIAIEDKEFYKHKGVSFRGILRAFTTNIRGDRVQGGSTITQQLVKNTLLSPERTFRRKVREILLAFLMEGTYTKDEILEMYFNEIPYGGSTYGVEEAAQRYFGKSARQLTLSESAFLAGLPASPTVYSPFGSTPEYAYARQREVLRRMVEDKYITEEQSLQARKEPLQFRQDTTDIKAPHFVMYVRNMLAKQYGEDILSQGGLEVRTTLDLDTQNQAQKIVTDEVNNLARLHIMNGAALITNPETGEILSMVGSKNYFDFTHDGQVNVTVRLRQPGSSIKPLTYAIALEHGANPATTIVDEPTSFSSPGSPPYVPKNYDGRFHGTVTIREALASSYNIPAVKTLASIGISTMIDKAELMGVTTWSDRKRFGLSLTLGGGEVMMTELAQIYGTFANYGETVKLNPILEVKNSHGEILYHNSCANDRRDCPASHTLNSKVAYQITDILKDNNARTPAFGPNSVLVIPGQEVAVKTGTTNNLHDNWTIGYTKDRVVAVWVGNNDNSAMSYVASGITGASPIWNKIIRTQLSADHPHVFPTPEGLIKVKVCSVTGTLPCKGCPSIKEDIFVKGTEPTQACNPAIFRPKPTPSPDPSKILDGVMIGQ
jgi:1A family penicillin-binding protein